MNPLDTPIGFSSTFLFVPGTRPERFAKALDSGADGVIIDLEDAVAQEDKESARAAIRAAWPTFTAEQKKRLVIRSNSPGSHFYAADLILVQELDVACLLIPKSESLDQMNGAAQILPNTAIIPMIETAIGLDRLNEIANSEQVLRLALGNIDLQADLGMVCDAQETELQTARFQIVLASRLAQIIEDEGQIFKVVKQIIIGTLHGHPMPLIIEAARSGISHHNQPSFAEVFDGLRG